MKRLPALALAACLAACGGGGGGGGESPSGGGGGGGTPIPPGNPGPSDVQFAINSGLQVHTISRFIYGKNGNDWAAMPWLTLDRSGGNRMTAYNWENNASNAGTDWLNQNDAYMGSSNVAGDSMKNRVAAVHTAGAGLIMTVPMCGYVAADKNPPGDVNLTPNYLQVRFRQCVAKKGSPFAYPPDTTDAYVYQDEFVSWLDGQFPYAKTDAARTLFYCLDNEPDLWSGTHPRIHPNPVGYDELRQKSIAYATAIKDVVPEAVVLGPVNYGWQGYIDLQGAPDAGANGDFIEYYLAAMKAADVAAGKRLVDVLDLHWYPEATGGGVRITDDSAAAAVAAARVQAPRSLWDPTYTETSWITQWSTGGPIRLIPRMKDKISAKYPGTKLAFTEYYYGGGGDISGAIAQADVLGIFGSEDVFAATLWHLGSTSDAFINGGFRMFRNYDGASGAFGNTSVAASTTNAANTSVYASVDAGSPNRLVVIAINKTGVAVSAGISVTHTALFTKAEVYQLTSVSSTPVKLADLPITAINAFVYVMPANSVTTLVLKP